ncbi:hypothetical protein [Streptococcus parauberis]|uniref:hypothetical protein n=1 Tax=Streptococcus parauberis TaxID=1348 RepID=UPI0035DC1021
MVVLDGHLSLLNQEGVIKKLPLSTFNGIKIKKIILKFEKPELIQERLYTRDGKKWTIDLITKFQQVEKLELNCFLRNIIYPCLFMKIRTS